MPELITIGETMIALVPGEHGLLRYNKDYRVRIAGAESNLAMGVQKLNHSAGWISRLGKDEFGQLILREIQSEGVDCSNVVWDTAHPTGLMFKQMEAKDTKVFYYREHSAASHLQKSDLKEEYFKGCKMLHITGITPVLSKSCKETVLEAVNIAKRQGCLISFDPNIRKKLWKDNDYRVLFKELLLQADVIEMGLEEGQFILGLNTTEEITEYLLKNNKNVIIAIKNGSNGVEIISNKGKIFIPPYPCHCIEPIGAGDAFNAGFLCGILEGKDLETCGKMGAIAGAMATEVIGDVENQPDQEQMELRLSEKQEVYR